MKIQVGKVYRNKLSNGTTGTSRFKIDTQWGPSFFEGRAVDSTGRAIGDPYLFSSFGSVLGFKGNTLASTFPWALTEDKKTYEYRTIYDNLVDNNWNTLSVSVPRYTFAGSKFMIREAGDNSTIRIVERDEFLRLQKA